MATCKKCDKAILDKAPVCPHCGFQQIGSEPVKATAGTERIRECQHCAKEGVSKGTGECRKGKLLDIDCSCEFCVQKSGIKSNNPFLIVPCAYCGGKGFFMVDTKPQRKEEKQKGGKTR